MIKKMAAAGAAVSVFGLVFASIPSVQARGWRSSGSSFHSSSSYHSSPSSGASHSWSSSRPSSSSASSSGTHSWASSRPSSSSSAAHAEKPMATPSEAAAAKPSMLGSIASTAAGTAGGVIAGNAISHAFEGSHADSSKEDSSAHAASAQAPHVIQTETAPADSDEAPAANKPSNLPEATDPCSVENERKSAKIEELCGQLHQELQKITQMKQKEDAHAG